jgi:hypothetical protein
LRNPRDLPVPHEDLLWHGTLRRHLDSILRHGLRPELGSVLMDVHGPRGPGRKLVFASGWDRAYDPVGVIQKRIWWDVMGRQGTRDWHKVGEDDIHESGLLVAVRRAGFKRCPDEGEPGYVDPGSAFRGNYNPCPTHPIGVEPGDWYTTRRVWPVAVWYGWPLVRLAKEIDDEHGLGVFGHHDRPRYNPTGRGAKSKPDKVTQDILGRLVVPALGVFYRKGTRTTEVPGGQFSVERPGEVIVLYWDGRPSRVLSVASFVEATLRNGTKLRVSPEGGKWW